MAQQKVKPRAKKRPVAKKRPSKVQTVKVSRIIWITLAATLAAIACLYLLVWNRVAPTIPGSYEYCAANGGYIIETYPTQCELDGTLYVEQIN